MHMTDYKSFAEEIQNSGEYNGLVLFDEQMKKHTTFKIGGAVPVFFEPADMDSLLVLLKLIKEKSVNFFILGGGSNIVFCDDGFDGLVVSMLKINEIQCHSVEDKETNPKGNVFLVTCGAGTTMAQFVNFCTQNQLTGAEQFAGLPGTLGGALFMNARCFDRSISDLFVEAYYIRLSDYTEQHATFKASEWDYKKSPFQNSNTLLLSVTLHLEKTEKSPAEIEEKNRYYIGERKSKGHFDFPSAGSVFRNNHDFGAPSGKIIDECGLRGYKTGGAQVAPFHGNFIINIGGATQKDVKALVEYVENVVREKTGFNLQPEIIFVDK